MFAPNYINQKEMLKYVDLKIDPSMVAMELIIDNIKLITNDKIIKLSKDNSFNSMFHQKIHRRLGFDIYDKDFIFVVFNSNLFSEEKLNSLLQHSVLLNKSNYSDFIIQNRVFQIPSIKKEVEILANYNNLLDTSCQNVRFIDLILLLLMECEVGNAQIFVSSFKIMGIYLLSNINDMLDFCESYQINVLLIILYKNFKIINTEMIDFIMNLSLGIEDINGINFFNPLYPKFITHILFDFHLFSILSEEIKLKIIEKIIDFMKNYIFIAYDNNFETKVIILQKLYKFLLLIENGTKVDEQITVLIAIILEQLIKIKAGGDSEPNEVI